MKKSLCLTGVGRNAIVAVGSFHQKRPSSCAKILHQPELESRD